VLQLNISALTTPEAKITPKKKSIITVKDGFWPLEVNKKAHKLN